MFILTIKKIIQESLYETVLEKKSEVSKEHEKINNRYGEFTVIHAHMAGMNDTILDRVAFGGVKDLEDLYQS